MPATKKAERTITLKLELRRREDAPAGYVPPTAEQAAEAAKRALEHEHEAYEVVITEQSAR